MTPEAVEAFVEAYLEYVQTPLESERGKELFWTFTVFAEAAYKNPQLCWKLILAVLTRDKSEEVRAALAAGPLEELLSYHGDEFIGTIEERALNDRGFRQMLRGVWKNEIDASVWARLQALTSELQ